MKVSYVVATEPEELQTPKPANGPASSFPVEASGQEILNGCSYWAILSYV